MEQRIMEVLKRMQPVLEDEELRELKNVLHMVFAGCDVAQKTEVQCVDDSWRIDLEDYLMSKALEGKSTDTVNRYRYEPVSYTHLDVYKRQEHGFTDIRGAKCPK